MTSPRTCDELAWHPIPRSERVYAGRVWNIRSEDVDLGEGGVVTREFMEHTGAVAILTLNDAGEVLLLRPYRNPVQRYLWYLTAGILSFPGATCFTDSHQLSAVHADRVGNTLHTPR